MKIEKIITIKVSIEYNLSNQPNIVQSDIDAAVNETMIEITQEINQIELNLNGNRLRDIEIEIIDNSGKLDNKETK